MKLPSTSIVLSLIKFLPLLHDSSLEPAFWWSNSWSLQLAVFSLPSEVSYVALSNDQSHTLVIQGPVWWPFVEMSSAFLPQITSAYNFLEDRKHFSANVAQKKFGLCNHEIWTSNVICISLTMTLYIIHHLISQRLIFLIWSTAMRIDVVT